MYLFLNVASYKGKVVPSLRLPMELGNSYCASLYTGLQSLVSHIAKNKVDTHHQGKRALLFSYGSGLAATLFSARIQGDLSNIATTSAFEDRLKKRVEVAPKLFEATLQRREEARNILPPKSLHLTNSFVYLYSTDTLR